MALIRADEVGCNIVKPLCDVSRIIKICKENMCSNNVGPIILLERRLIEAEKKICFVSGNPTDPRYSRRP